MNKESDSNASIAGPSRCMSSDVETNSSSDNTFTTPAARSINTVPAAKKRKTRSRIFRLVWLEDPAFKPWLQQLPSNPYKGKCSICNINIRAIKSNLLHHGSSEEHMENMKYKKSSVETSTDASTSTDEPTSMDVGTESSSDNISFGPPAKKVKRQMHRQQRFHQAWLEDPAFKCWLQQVQDDPYNGKCTICCKHITAIKSNLHHHANSQEHIYNMKYGKGSLISTGEATKNFSDKVKMAEIRVCIDAIEHNRSFHSFVHFVRMLQKTLPDQHLLKDMSLSPKKMAAITENVINKSIITETIENVQGKFFSILINETADISDMKIVVFLIRYVHKGLICTDLLDLVRIKEATGEKLYQCFRQSLKKYNLPISNMVGVCVDNANVMVGVHNSLTSRLIAANAEMCILPCICHSLHLAARHACECLPEHVEKFLQSLYSYFSQSPKRLSMLEGTQQFLSVKKRKVLQPSTTRWLALYECIKRVLSQWTPLFCVIAEASNNESVANKILTSMNSPFTKAYLEFMDFFLKMFTYFNNFFQSSKVLIHRLLPECKRLLALLGINFIKSEKLDEPNIHKIDIYNEENLLPLTLIFPGTECQDTLSKITNDNSEENEDIIQFYTNIKKCYQTGYQQIVDRVPFDDKFLNTLDFLNPQTAVVIDNRVGDKVECILQKFKSKFDRAVVLNEWHLLPGTYFGDAKEKIKVMSLPEFWHETSIITVNEDEYLYKNISKLAQLCLTLPHSNADVERYFSIVTQIKTRGRNRLHTETVAALTRIKLDMTNQSAYCYNYKITDEMIKLFNNSMYSTDEISEELLGNILADEVNQSTNE